MPLQYRRPGVYLEESLLVNPAEVSGAVTVACFVGAASQGPIEEPTLIEAWSDFVALFGSFGSFHVPDVSGDPQPDALSYLPYAVYSFFQSGGRTAYIIRAVPAVEADRGAHASIDVNGEDDLVTPLTSFAVQARSVGTWGNNIKYDLTIQNTGAVGEDAVFTLQVFIKNSQGADELAETYSNLSVKGLIPGSKRVDSTVNDPFSGSQYISITSVNEAQPNPVASASPVSLAGGEDPALPGAADLQDAALMLTKVEGPIALNLVGYLADASKAETADASSAWVGTTTTAAQFPDRQDIFIVNDNAPPRPPGQSSASYKSAIQGSSHLGANTGDSYSASYAPWVIIPDPKSVGHTVSIPPGGGVIGVMARIDATIGVFRAPAGVIAGITNAVGVQTKFTDTELGDLNNSGVNIIRSVVGAGIAIMGARTRKSIGADKYVSPRRTLIYIKEVLKRSTQFAVFENNDQRLWASLRMAADRILQPLWDAGGLKGNNPSEAYYIRCDDTINTPNVIQSGEVRMEVGVALEYPAEFVIIRVTQFDRATFTSEVLPIA